MPRSNRIIFEGAIYHIFHRGNNKEYIFENPKHKSFFLKQLKEFNRKFDYELLAYVIMDNHYHMLIKSNKDPINSIMFNINNVLGKYLNRELDRTGHIFEGRYNSKLVDSDAYLLWLLIYIHRNPIRAKICNNINEYKWSSDYLYRNGIDEFVNTNFILNIISNERQESLLQYLKLMNFTEISDDSKFDYELINETLKLNFNLISSTYKEIIRDKAKTFKEILDYLMIDNSNIELLISGSKKRFLTPLKISFIKESLSNKYTFKEISCFLNTTPGAVSKLFSTHLANKI